MDVDLNKPCWPLWISGDQELEAAQAICRRSGFVLEDMCGVSRGHGGETGREFLVQKREDSLVAAREET